jgi:hypothetical protein
VPKAFAGLSAAVIIPYAIAVPLAFVRVEAALAIFVVMPPLLFAIDAIFPAHAMPVRSTTTASESEGKLSLK